MTIAVAMSGGVDSSTAAAILAESNSLASGEAPSASSNGAEAVVGLTMQLWNQRRLPGLQGLEQGVGTPGHASGRCCSLDDVYDARRVANFLGIPYYVVNFEQRFEQDVVRPFVERYLAGATPIPCSLCDESTGRCRLLAAVDRSKDQSYFLFGLTQEQLARSVFPLGELTKDRVRSIAREKRLPVAEKPESQEICFVPSGSYRDFIQAYLAEQGVELERRPGELVTTNGRVLGEHQGLYNYTVGQRKGLGVAVGAPLYVIELDRERNRVVVGPNEELFGCRCLVRDVNWIRLVREGELLEAAVKIRNKHAPAPARVEAVSSGARGEARVEFLEPQRAITPGQAAVFYDGDEIVGGGWIAAVP